MDSRQSVVVIGAGVMGGVYARALAHSGLRFRARLVGICDIDASAAERLAAETGTQAFTDLGDMLVAVKPDMAYLAVPDHVHREPFIEVVTRGVACLVEKPLATTVEDALAMTAAAAAAGVRAEVNFSNHWNPVLQRAREAVSAGDVGEVVGVNARLSNTLDYPTKHIRWASRTTSGWFLLSHLFDLTSWLMDAHATDVTASGVRGKKLASMGVDTYDIIQCLVRYEQGWSGLYESAWVLPNSLPSMVDFKFEIVGTEGSIYIDTQDQMVHVASGSAVSYPGTLDWTDRRLSAFLDALGTDGVSGQPLNAGIENTALLVALHESLEQDRTVHVPRLEDLAARISSVPHAAGADIADGRHRG
jgi:predicted dehydrogenase